MFAEWTPETAKAVDDAFEALFQRRLVYKVCVIFKLSNRLSI